MDGRFFRHNLDPNAPEGFDGIASAVRVEVYADQLIREVDQFDSFEDTTVYSGPSPFETFIQTHRDSDRATTF